MLTLAWQITTVDNNNINIAIDRFRFSEVRCLVRRFSYPYPLYHRLRY